MLGVIVGVTEGVTDVVGVDDRLKLSDAVTLNEMELVGVTDGVTDTDDVAEPEMDDVGLVDGVMEMDPDAEPEIELEAVTLEVSDTVGVTEPLTDVELVTDGVSEMDILIDADADELRLAEGDMVADALAVEEGAVGTRNTETHVRTPAVISNKPHDTWRACHNHAGTEIGAADSSIRT